MGLSLTSGRFLLINAICCALVSGCATTPEPIIRTVEVLVPYPVSCVPDTLGPAQEYPDSLNALAAADAYERTILLRRARILRRDRLADLEGVVEGCR